MSAQFMTSFSRTLVILHPADTDQLRVELFTVFTDTSGRPPIHSVALLQRGGENQAPSASGPADSDRPLQRSPANGSVFNDYPRTTTLEWASVPGATKYGVEIDCFHCCQTGRWCTDVGRPGRLAVVDGLTYTWDFVGAQPGRWRVWAILPSGEEGPKSDWWEFRYTR